MADSLPPKGTDKEVPKKYEPTEIVRVLEGYKQEAVQNRQSGPNNRDDKWDENLDLYWNRYDFSEKADWQAKETMPEVPAFVDRFAAALKDALVAAPNGFYTIDDPADQEQDLGRAIKEMTDVWLSTCGRNQMGTPLGFPTVFEEQTKLGAIMACSSATTWKNDVPKGRVAIETVDPRCVWLDHTYRNLYRIRRIEVDRHELRPMAKQFDKKGDPIFNIEEIDRSVSDMVTREQQRREALTGHGHQVTSDRQPIVIDEYLATIVMPDGEVVAENALCLVADGEYLIRGPETNPFWHKRDWLSYTPLIHTPLSVYGRSYMEDFGSVAKTFTELTNLLLDAVFTSSMKAFAMAPGLLINPEQASEGIHPNKIFLLEEGVRPSDFAEALDLGQLPNEAVAVWNAIKNELREAADINEVGLGQFAPKSRTSATEVASAQQSSSALVRSIAQTVEDRWLSPTLDLVWKTGLQHMRQDDAVLAAAAGEDMFQAIYNNRKELIKRKPTFQANGISALIQKSRMLRSIIQLFQIIGSNEALLGEFMKRVDLGKLINLLFELSDININRLSLTERERLTRQVAEPLNQAAERGQRAGGGGGRAASEAQQIASDLGIARGGA